MVRQFRHLAFAVLRYSGLPFLLRWALQRRSVTIVVYHAPSAIRVREHFLALKQRYSIIALGDYLRARTEGASDRLPPRSLVITLDDGHRSNIELKPVLENLKIPATIFLCSGIAGTNRHFWWLCHLNASETEACKKMPDSERLRFLESKDYRFDREYPERQALSRAEIEQLKSSVDFEAHTVNHPILPSCTDAAAAHEIRDCKTALEKEFNLKIQALAFPNGDYSEREIQLARQAGYQCALTLEHGFNTAATDLFELRRIPLPDECSVNELLVKTSGLWDILRRRGTRKASSAAGCPAAACSTAQVILPSRGA